MADHLTYGLADMGYNVNKLVPWGPIKRLFPYLLRRVQVCCLFFLSVFLFLFSLLSSLFLSHTSKQENQDVFSGTQFERELLWHELKRRKFGLFRLGESSARNGWNPRTKD